MSRVTESASRLTARARRAYRSPSVAAPAIEPVVETAPEPVIVPPARVDPRQVEQFLYREARLLDERRWDDWLALWTEDARYWMPVRSTPAPEVGSTARPIDDELAPEGGMSWFDDNHVQISMRVAKQNTGRAYAEEPPSRTRRFITNVEVDDDASPDDVFVRSNLLIYRGRLGSDVEFLSGCREDHLVLVDGGFRIRERLVKTDTNVMAVSNLSLFF